MKSAIRLEAMLTQYLTNTLRIHNLQNDQFQKKFYFARVALMIYHLSTAISLALKGLFQEILQDQLLQSGWDQCVE